MTVYFTRLSGVVTEPDKICDELLLAVFASDYSQSNAFLGSVSSFQHLVHAAGNNVLLLRSSMTDMFKDLFQRHFSLATVNIDVEPIEGDDAKLAITMSAILTTSEGQRLDFSSMINASNGMATQILVGERLLWKPIINQA